MLRFDGGLSFALGLWARLRRCESRIFPLRTGQRNSNVSRTWCQWNSSKDAKGCHNYGEWLHLGEAKHSLNRRTIDWMRRLTRVLYPFGSLQTAQPQSHLLQTDNPIRTPKIWRVLMFFREHARLEGDITCLHFIPSVALVVSQCVFKC
jgi:hypothetical protein